MALLPWHGQRHGTATIIYKCKFKIQSLSLYLFNYCHRAVVIARAVLTAISDSTMSDSSLASTEKRSATLPITAGHLTDVRYIARDHLLHNLYYLLIAEAVL